MKKFLALVALVGLLATPMLVDASIANNIVAWEDIDYETIFDIDGTKTATPGDFFIGMWQIESIGMADSPPLAADLSKTAVFLMQANTVATPGGLYGGIGGSRLEFMPVAYVDTNLDGFDDNWADLGLKRTAPGTVAVLYEDTNGGVNPDVDTLPGGIPADLATAQDGTMLWEIGFTGAAGAQEFWVADITSITLPPPGGIALDYVASLNVTATGAGGISLPHSYFSDLPLPPSQTQPWLWDNMETTKYAGAPIVSQWQLKGGLQAVDSGDFSVATTTDIFHAVPEPASVVIWSVMGVAALAVLRMRRRKP